MKKIRSFHGMAEVAAATAKTRMVQLADEIIAVLASDPNATVKITVDIAAAALRDGGLSLRIRDTGIGMSPEEICRALELFGQVDNSLSRRFDGTGLGLPLAVQLTELHGGTLTIESAPGVGTAVIVRLPASRIISDQGNQAEKGWEGCSTQNRVLRLVSSR